MTDQEPTQTPSSPEEKPHAHKSRGQDKGKGATEEDDKQSGNTGMQNQLGHRDEDTELKDADSSLPG
jgi:hypothetical protein